MLQNLGIIYFEPLPEVFFFELYCNDNDDYNYNRNNNDDRQLFTQFRHYGDNRMSREALQVRTSTALSAFV